MSRVAGAVLLIMLGLGLGLWLGFNPQGRELVQQNAEKANQTYVRVGAEVSAWWAGLTGEAAASETETEQAPTAMAEPSEVAALQEVWDATRQVWLSLLARFKLES